ncbi:DUF1329 domain-containing protein [Pseudomonas jessenii]|uniref:DUF1329 domain-containing protein n=1 Tax=Pseudomonas jessenii TaxID=77298 RepID=UPI0038922DA5
MKLMKSLIATGLTMAIAGVSHAAVTPEQAKQLGTTLTPLGAEMAGNADGSIPAFTGGLASSTANGADPFAGETPRLVITAKNLTEQKTKLTAATQQLLSRYPSFRLDVYPTHRTVALPKVVEENTLKNAVTAKTSNDGLAMENALPGVPFPIPQDGNEVMWNHLTRYAGQAYHFNYESWNVDSSGNPSLSAGGELTTEYPLYAPDRINSGKMVAGNEIFYMIKVEYDKPARRAGEAVLVKDAANPLEQPRRAWQYLPGQRRVKLAPDIAYDTPNPGSSGTSTYDDTFLFSGAMDRFDFKLIGKKEIYVPYNTYKLNSHSKVSDLTTPNHLNPDLVRWEQHRVWVVEATLKPGKRHIYSKRTFYIDEDSWTALASDQYDARGQLYRGGFAFLTYNHEMKAPNGDFQMYYDFMSGAYNINVFYGNSVMKYTAPLSKAQWSPDSLAGTGIR